MNVWKWRKAQMVWFDFENTLDLSDVLVSGADPKIPFLLLHMQINIIYINLNV